MHPMVQMRDDWTVADLDALALQDWWRYEIVDGALVVSPAAGRAHEFASEDLRAIIREALPDGFIVVGPAGVAFRHTYRVPDLVVVSRSLIKGDGPFDPLEVLLAVEVVSPGSQTTDRITKPAQYAAAGIVNYWRVETDPLSLTAYALDAGTYREAGAWGPGELAELTRPFAVTVEIDRLG